MHLRESPLPPRGEFLGDYVSILRKQDKRFLVTLLADFISSAFVRRFYYPVLSEWSSLTPKPRDHVQSLHNPSTTDTTDGPVIIVADTCTRTEVSTVMCSTTTVGCT